MKSQSANVADQIITKLSPVPHPKRTAILFVPKPGEAGHWHRVDADARWLFHAGAPDNLMGGLECARHNRLWPTVMAGELPEVLVQGLVQTGHWQSAQSSWEYARLSCTVSPNFEFAGFELAAPAFDLPDCEPPGGR